MKHAKKYEEMLMLFHLGELSEMEISIFQAHLKTCDKCQQELNELQEMAGILDKEPEEQPTMEMVQKANRNIMAELNKSEKETSVSSIKEFLNDFADSFAQLFAQPKVQLSGMAATLVIGVLIGKAWLSTGLKNNPDMMIHLLSNNTSLSTEQYQKFQNTLANSMLKSGNVEVEDFLNDQNVSEDGIISVSYKLKNNFEARGGLDDPVVRNMLLYSARQDESPGKRMQAVNLLSSIGMTDKIEETFSAVILHDENDKIRLKVADILSHHNLKKETLESFKSVALKDDNSDMRLKAIEVLQSQNAENLETVLAVMATRDRNKEVKQVATEALESIAKDKSD